ncbi:MAG: hypothetical protein HC925_05510 [Coleofasciculaceae cyanobacterium SM2_3_26]|nr:hypothetical protein [Coleofasciculaceae cyanobacterium SM2_3_26]
MQKTQAQRKELQDFLWVVADQLATSEREIQVLRQEYREVEQKLDRYNALLERRAWYVSQLAIITQEGDRLTSMAQERQQLVHLLQNGVAPEIEAELHHLEATLKQHNYDEKKPRDRQGRGGALALGRD